MDLGTLAVIDTLAQEGGATVNGNGATTVAPPFIEKAPLPLPSVEVTPTTPTYIYSMGRIEARLPSLGVENEYRHAVKESKAKGTEKQVLYAVLNDERYRFLARQMCWVLQIGDMDTYVLQPRDPEGYNLLINAIRPPQSDKHFDLTLDLVIGTLGPLASAEQCNGLMVPVAIFDQIYTFTVEDLIHSIPPPKKTMATQELDTFYSRAEELFGRMVIMADNAGTTDSDRAINFLAVRYPEIYANAARMGDENNGLSGVETRPSRLNGPRNVIEVIFSFRNRETDVTSKFFACVDVTEEFPFLTPQGKLAEFFEH